MSDRRRHRVDPAGVADLERRAREAAAEDIRDLDPDITEQEIDDRLSRAEPKIVVTRAKGVRRGDFPKVERLTTGTDPAAIRR